jgi:hypothetical protein
MSDETLLLSILFSQRLSCPQRPHRFKAAFYAYASPVPREAFSCPTITTVLYTIGTASFVLDKVP